MTLERRLAAAFRLDDQGWRRHANPWSVWTRFATLPVLVLALWSRVWLGWWALLPIAAVLAWTWLNPRLFPPPPSYERWASKGVLGERLWIDRDRVPVPAGHRKVPHVLSAVSLAGVALMAWGLVTLSAWPTLSGAALCMGAKLWFVDRMVWLYEDMRRDSGAAGA